MKIEICKSENIIGYYIYIEINDENGSTDNFVSDLIGMELDEYQHMLIKEYNGFIYDYDEVYIKKKEDAEKLVKWLENMLLVSKLRGII